MPYKDFEITVGRADKEGRHGVLVNSPEGGFAGTFVNPIIDVDFDKLIDSRLRVRSAKDMGETKPVETTDDIDDLGDRLSEALFQGKVLAAYAKNKGALKPREGLRLRIRIDPNSEEYAKLMNLPWEFLKDVLTGDRIELTYEGAIVRNPITPATPASFAIKPPVRILVAICQPSDYPDLKIGKEILSFVKTAEKSEITVKFLEDVTPQTLFDEMNKAKEEGKEYHIFHFIGHGGVDNRGKSALVFKGDGENTFVDAELLKVALGDSVRFVFLNACETASIPVVDPFAAFPTELLNKGIPAVVAMQFPISNKAAIRFCEGFYTCMTKGIPVDQCMGEARRRLFTSKERAEWGTPVLFMNLPDGMLFDIKKPEVE